MKEAVRILEFNSSPSFENEYIENIICQKGFIWCLYKNVVEDQSSDAFIQINLVQNL